MAWPQYIKPDNVTIPILFMEKLSFQKLKHCFCNSRLIAVLLCEPLSSKSKQGELTRSSEATALIKDFILYPTHQDDLCEVAIDPEQ